MCAALDYASNGCTGLNFFDGRGQLAHVVPYSQLRAEAEAFARVLIERGIARGERLVLVADTSPAFCAAFFGAQYAGLIPVPVSPPIGMGAKASFIDQLKKQILATDAIGILAPEELQKFAESAARDTTARMVEPLSGLGRDVDQRIPLRPLQADEASYIQLSSGSTREPRGILIRQQQLMANIDASLSAQSVCETDSGVSWLPLYHDMGLIGFVLAPMCSQRSVDLMSPYDFARRPLTWLSLISKRRASITYSPSFAFELVAKRAEKQSIDDLDLSCLRLAGVGADMIQPSALRRFADVFAGHGFDRRAFMASYGMAEVCVGLTFTSPFSGIRTDAVRDAKTGHTRHFVVCGEVLPEHSVQIRDGAGASVGERQIGRLFARGPSVMRGYWGEESRRSDLAQTGWLDTGDLGYWKGREIVITGRAKDLMISNGRNIWPQDIEWAVESLPRIGQGACCAFSVDVDACERIVVLVERSPTDDADRASLEGEIRQVVREASGVEAAVVLIARKPGLPRTSSGKMARAKAKEQFVGGAYTPAAANAIL